MGLRDVLYPAILAVLGAVLAAALLAPFRSESFPRADGTVVPVPALDRLSTTSDTWDYLQLGRSLWQGKGFSSRFTYPPFLPESVGNEDDGGARFPLLWRQPGFPVLVAAAFRLHGSPHPDALLFLQGAAIVLLPVAVFLLGRTVLPGGWAALAALWALLSPVALGVPGPPVATTWFVVGVALLAVFLLTARSALLWIGGGLGLGLLVLLRLETWILAPGLLLVAVLGSEGGLGRRLAGALGMLGVAALVTLPWHLRLAEVTGDPFYNAGSLLYHDVGPFPGWTASRSLAVRDQEPWAFLAAHGADVGRKVLLDLARYGRDLVLLPSPLLPPLAFLALVRPPRERRGRALVVGGAVMLVSLVLFLVPLQYAARFVAVLVPFLSVGAALTLIRLPRFGPALAVFAVLLGIGMLGRSWTARPRLPEEATAARAAGSLDRLLERPEAEPLRSGATALTDVPTIYAWIWDRPAVWAPVPGDVAAVRQLLPHSVGAFTCSRQPGDAVEPGLAGLYAAGGGRLVPARGCPRLVVWAPSPSPEAP